MNFLYLLFQCRDDTLTVTVLFISPCFTTEANSSLPDPAIWTTPVRTGDRIFQRLVIPLININSEPPIELLLSDDDD